MTKVPAGVQKALKQWRENRDLIVEMVTEQGVRGLANDDRDTLLSAAEELAVAVDRWLPAPSTTGGGER